MLLRGVDHDDARATPPTGHIRVGGGTMAVWLPPPVQPEDIGVVLVPP